ncbi:MAG: PD-(D/E)XK nuclease family protein, partial [Ghiorsea sp.]|nr:PD-(D/E)XK nuclease family protein [Ghiorsea sp.]
GKRLLLSPIPQHGQDPTYELIRSFEKQRDELEIARLLYVACTRAERELHMFGEVSDSNQQPKSSSLLARLYQPEDECFGATETHHTAQTHEDEGSIQAKLQCLPAIFSPPSPFASINTKHHTDDSIKQNIKPEFNWASAQARAVGIALHAAIQRIAEQGLAASNQEELLAFMSNILHQEGISSVYIKQALNRCQQGLKQCFSSARFQWIVSAQHQDAHNEWALTYVDNDICKHVVLDRSFIDEGGTRWIVDYKTGWHQEEDLDVWLDQELIRYTVDTPQLLNYVKVLQALEPDRDIKAALYFPMMDGWREWESVLS